jgi:hypothetical protein
LSATLGDVQLTPDGSRIVWVTGKDAWAERAKLASSVTRNTYLFDRLLGFESVELFQRAPSEEALALLVRNFLKKRGGVKRVLRVRAQRVTSGERDWEVVASVLLHSGEQLDLELL